MPKKSQKSGSAASSAKKAADTARETHQKRPAEDERAREEEEMRSDEESGGDAGEFDYEVGGGTKDKANCSFSAKKEVRLVEFFSVNPVFYDKSHLSYQNHQQKNKLLDQLAKELNTTRKQIQGWFKNMRTSVGKLYKTKSGQANQPLTARKKWQLQNFAFLKAHIVPCTYIVETTPFQPEETGEQSEDEESLHSIPTRPASPSPSTSARNTKPPTSKKSKIDDLLMKFLDRPRPEEVLSKQLETIAAATAPASPQLDERTAFSQWVASRMSGIPQDRWDDFLLAAMRRPNPDTSQSPSAQPRPMPPVQQHWPHFPQQQQQWVRCRHGFGSGHSDSSSSSGSPPPRCSSHRYSNRNRCRIPAPPLSHRSSSLTHPFTHPPPCSQ